MNCIKDITLLVLLGISSITDIKRKEISFVVLFLGVVAGIIFCLLMPNREAFWSSLISGISPGLLLIGISVLSEGKIGMGDGFIVGMGGIFLGFEKAMSWVFTAFLLCALWGMGNMLFQKKSYKSEVAFVPFLFVAVIGVFLKEIG